ncbi:MAG: chemotaxis protein CheA [Planctomycetes bacterium]|nr:chemotaxis protein CheA [Planctomycetota bacterium]
MSEKNCLSESPSERRAQAEAALSGLTEATSTPLDQNDLGRLARMHTWCQTLSEAAVAAGKPGKSPVCTLSGELTTLLEAIILGEAQHTSDGLAVMPEAIIVLRGLFQGQETDIAALVQRIRNAVRGAPAGNAEDAAAPALSAVEPPATPEPAAATAPPPAEDCTRPPPAAAETFEAEGVNEPAANAQAAETEAYVSEPLILDLSEREHLEGFLDESREHLDAIEGALLEVEQDPADASKINELFRPFHTIKGIAGFLNLRDINRLTHEVETILDMARKNELEITSATIDLVFAAIDILTSQIAAIREYLPAPTGEAVPQPEVASIIGRLRQVAAGNPPPPVEKAARAALAQKTGEILVAQGATEPEVVDFALDRQELPQEQRKVGEILVDMGNVSRKQVGKALVEQQARREVAGKAAVDQSIRVDTAKLDVLVDAVGELVIAQTMVSLNETIRGADEKLTRDVSQVSKIVRDVQETAMAMRMVPIGHTFQKMRRLVRDVSHKAGKEVELIITGEETELDKTVIQQISDPLVHMVRNAVDHGIEPPAERRARGKPEVGTVHLNAYHQGDSIVIDIRDDGGGLDRDVLIAKGIERGVISAEDQLSDQQAYALIMAPGFSTARQVTDISGRGVGMDVVKRNIEQLRGKIEIASEKGKGSTFSIRLPLTLAIIDGMLVRVGQERVIIPTILIEQSLRPKRKQITTVQRRGEMLQVRGELCPLIQLGGLFGYSECIDPCQALVVIAHCDGCKIGLVVDGLIGQQQVVIKSLAERFKHVKGISGAAILGDGRVGLILEPSGLLALHSVRRTAGYGHLRAGAAADDTSHRSGTEDATAGQTQEERDVTESGAAGQSELAAAST